MIFGIDYLAGAKYPARVVRFHKDGLAAGFFCNTFGSVWPLIDKLLARRKVPLIRVHAVWADDHRYKPEVHKPIVDAEYARVLAYADKYPEVRFSFSPMCEHTMGSKFFMQNFGYMLEQNKVTIVSSPMTGAHITKDSRVQNEMHGASRYRRATYFSYDGQSAFDANVAKDVQIKGLQVFFMWAPAFNMRRKIDDNTPRHLRTYRPKREHFETLQFYTEVDPKLAEQVTPNMKAIWKPVAEDVGDSKSNKVVLISNKLVKSFTIRDATGKVLDVMRYFGRFGLKQHRYYSTKYAVDIVKGLASPVVDVYDDTNNKKYVTVIPPLRAGSFR